MEINQTWIDEQRAVCEAATVAPWSWNGDALTSHWTDVISVSDNEGGASFSLEIDESDRAFIAAARTALPAALDALEAAYAEIARLTAERDAVPEIDLRPIQPGHMGVCMTDEEDGIQIRKASHNHPQGRGYLSDDEEVQDVAVIRFSEASQVMAVVDRLTILAKTMAEKVRTSVDNAPTGAESENHNGTQRG